MCHKQCASNVLKIKHIIGFSLLFVYVIVMMSFTNIAYNALPCKNVDIVIKDSITTRFVQKNDVYQLIKDSAAYIFSNTSKDVNLNKIERQIDNHPSIKSCDCYFLVNGNMRIDITQRHPIARVMTHQYNFYIDELGNEMPTSSFYTAHVPVITGYVKKELIGTDLFLIASTIQNNPFLEALIEQIDVTSKGEYVLIPRAGRQTIELGDAENLEVKFKSLKALYLQVFNNNAWNKYQTISLKYEGQVVCTEK